MVHLPESVFIMKERDESELLKAKQRCSVKWLLSKAYNNKVPDDLQEPFYRDHEDVEHLKPNIVHAMANAELYCLALGNIYADPNYHNLNHWGIIQALARKGVYVAEPSDVALTETVLIQVTPLKMSAHMAVIEAIMTLYMKEVMTPDRVVATVQRFADFADPEEIPTDQEEALLLWINKSCSALKQKIESELETDNVSENDEPASPNFPVLQDLSDISNGIGLAALVSFYSPHELSWTEIAINDPPSMADSLYNIQLVQRFCREGLPHDPCHLTLEDVVYMHSSVKQNILAFLADLFTVFEVRPPKCIHPPGWVKEKIINIGPPEDLHRISKSPSVGFVTNLPRRQNSMQDKERGKRYSLHEGVSKSPYEPKGSAAKRTHSMNMSDSPEKAYVEARGHDRTHIRDQRYTSDEHEDFVIHRGRIVPTLSNITRSSSPHSSDEPLIPARLRPSKEKFNNDSKLEEKGEDGNEGYSEYYNIHAAGKPTDLGDRKLSYAGRRSRRNSISDDSQLTVENFGGSQENLSFIGRNPDKELFAHIGKKCPSSGEVPNHSRLSDSNKISDDMKIIDTSVESEIDNRLLDNRDIEDCKIRSRDSSPFSGKQIVIFADQKSNLDCLDGESSDIYVDKDGKLEKPTSFAELSKLRENVGGGINIVYMQHDREPDGKNPVKSSFLTRKGSEKKTTSFASLPNTTTWQQQSITNSQRVDPYASDEQNDTQVMASQLHNVRMSLEEKRRRIENEKAKMELVMNRQRQKLGKAAFLQAVAKGKGSGCSTPDSGGGGDVMADSVEPAEQPQAPQRPFSLQEISDDLSSVKQKWLSKDGSMPVMEERRTPDIENMDMDQYHQSITQWNKRRQNWYMEDAVNHRMTSSLHDLQSDIHHLASQQQQMAALMSAATTMTSQVPTSTYQAPIPIPVANTSQEAQQFFLHEQSPRRTCGQPQPMNIGPSQQQPMGMPDMYGQTHPSGGRREQWGQPQPVRPPTGYVDQQAYMMHHPQEQQRYLHPSHQMAAGSGPGPLCQNGGPMVDQYYYGSPYERQGGYGVQKVPVQGYHSSGHSIPGYPNTQVPQGYPSSQPVSNMEYPSSASQHAPFRLHTGAEHAVSRSVSCVPTAEPVITSSANISLIEPSVSQQNTSQQNSPSKLAAYRARSPQRESPLQSRTASANQYQSPSNRYQAVTGQHQSVLHAPLPAPPIDDMEPQNVSFIEAPPDDDEAAGLPHRIQRLNITSGSKTYRIPHEHSPPRPTIGYGRTFKVHTGRKDSEKYESQEMSGWNEPPVTINQEEEEKEEEIVTDLKTERLKDGIDADKGFYISFEDDDGPKRPKPALKNKKPSPRKPLSQDSFSSGSSTKENMPPEEKPHRKLSPSKYGQDTKHEEPLSHSLLHNTPERLIEKVGIDSTAVEDMAEYVPKYSSCEEEEDNAGTLGVSLVIGNELMHPNPDAVDEMERKKERIMLLSLRRKQRQEELKAKKEEEAQKWREQERIKEEQKALKKEEEKARKAAILEQYKLKKAIEEAEREGKVLQMPEPVNAKPVPRLRQKTTPAKPRPKTIHVDNNTVDGSELELASSHGKRGSSSNLSDSKPSGLRRSVGKHGSNHSLSGGRSSRRGSNVSLCEQAQSPSVSSRTYEWVQRGSRRRGSASSLNNEDSTPHSARILSGGHSGRRESTMSSYGRDPWDTYHGYRGSLHNLRSGSHSGRKGSSVSLYGLGPGSLPPGLISKRRGFDDGASDVSSTASSSYDYTGPRLYKQPAAKSNRSIILNAVEYCVFPGVVNKEAKQRVLEEIAKSESKHFLVLFRDAGCQFRALYSYCPEREEVLKLYGTGPRQVTDKMYDKFFKYNSGGKCFSQIHTKHLTVTIDAFTIHNSLWQGKKVNLPNKKDMTLVT